MHVGSDESDCAVSGVVMMCIRVRVGRWHACLVNSTQTVAGSTKLGAADKG